MNYRDFIEVKHRDYKVKQKILSYILIAIIALGIGMIYLSIPDIVVIIVELIGIVLCVGYKLHMHFDNTDLILHYHDELSENKDDRYEKINNQEQVLIRDIMNDPQLRTVTKDNFGMYLNYKLFEQTRNGKRIKSQYSLLERLYFIYYDSFRLNIRGEWLQTMLHIKD